MYHSFSLMKADSIFNMQTLIVKMVQHKNKGSPLVMTSSIFYASSKKDIKSHLEKVGGNNENYLYIKYQ